jgi:hypothetical protein
MILVNTDRALAGRTSRAVVPARLGCSVSDLLSRTFAMNVDDPLFLFTAPGATPSRRRTPPAVRQLCSSCNPAGRDEDGAEAPSSSVPRARKCGSGCCAPSPGRPKGARRKR